VVTREGLNPGDKVITLKPSETHGDMPRETGIEEVIGDRLRAGVRSKE